TRFSRDWSSDVCSSDLNSNGQNNIEGNFQTRRFFGIDRQGYIMPGGKGAELQQFLPDCRNALLFLRECIARVQGGKLDGYAAPRSEERRVGKGRVCRRG